MSDSQVQRPFEVTLRQGDELFELTRRGAYLLLSGEGLYLGSARLRQDADFVPYADLTHVVPTARGLWLGTRRTVRPVTRGRHASLVMRDVARAIEARIAQRPGGVEQLARMREVDAFMRRGKGRWLVVLVAAACVAAHALQIHDQFLSEVGVFAPALVREGELWRLVTAHFLHLQGLPPVQRLWQVFGPSLSPWLPVHIAVNTALALLFAHMVEQPLGRLRTAIVLGVSAATAMLACLPAGDDVLGASGMVLGLAGAALALEIHSSERLPAPWRIPRRLFVGVLFLELLLGFALDFVAGWAHIGGFAGGYLMGCLLGPGALLDRPAPVWVRPAAGTIAVAVAASLAAALPLLLRDVGALNRHAAKLLAIENATPRALNDLAWRIATESAAEPDETALALELAQRAVEATDQANPDFLDTLAEVQFLSGDPLSAVETIDRAIEIAPWVDYFRGQRDRFAGLRDPDDRPPPPSVPWFRFEREPAWVEDGVEI